MQYDPKIYVEDGLLNILVRIPLLAPLVNPTPQRGRGRPRVLSKVDEALIFKLATAGATVDALVDSFSASRATIFRAIKKGREANKQ